MIFFIFFRLGFVYVFIKYVGLKFVYKSGIDNSLNIMIIINVIGNWWVKKIEDC